MAVREVEDDLEGKPEELKTKKVKGKASPVKKLLIASGVLLMIGLSVGVTLYLTGGFDAEEDQEEQADAGKGDKKGDAKNKKDKNDKKDKKKIPLAPPVYFPIEQPFVVNFTENGVMHYVQITVEVMARDPALIEQFKLHLPVVKNNLVALFSSQTTAVLSTREGKDALRVAALVEIRKILENETGTPGIEQVYFTSFVMQ